MCLGFSHWDRRALSFSSCQDKHGGELHLYIPYELAADRREGAYEMGCVGVRVRRFATFGHSTLGNQRLPYLDTWDAKSADTLGSLVISRSGLRLSTNGHEMNSGRD